jgi:hypothetical protein
VLGILLISLILRWILILRGGQYYIADETHYEVSRDAARLLIQGQVGDALRQFTLSPEHLAFKVVGLIPALIEHIVGPSLVLPAMFFSLFSILNLYLIFLLSVHSQGSQKESLYALFFAACCLSLLYYSRHLFPYDMAMSFGLLALYVALTRPQSIKTSLLCGSLAFLCFITYNGYWTLAIFVMFANILMNSENITALLKRAACTAAGFIAPLSLLFLAMFAVGTNMMSAYRLFATSITQGAFEEGWSLPFAYFWHTEHTGILIFVVLCVLAIIRLTKDREQVTMLWVAGVFFIYTCLVIPSVLLHDFVVYGRLARQMLPFLILLSATGLSQIEHLRLSRANLPVGILVLTLLQAAWNFGQSYQLSYPRQFSEELQAQYRGFEFSTKRLAYGAPTVCQSNGYIIENAKYFLSAPEITQAVNGELLREVSHPVNFLPYQYEGYTPAQRQEFREGQLKMRFYKVDHEFLSGPGLEIKNCAIRGTEE